MSTKNSLKAIALALHRTAARFVWTARIYLAIYRVAGLLLPQRQRNQITNSLNSVAWPAAALSPQSVILGGDTAVRLVPHSGEEDFRALLGGAFEYEKHVFMFLDARISQYDTIIEIGANVGIYTTYFAQRFARLAGSRKIFAFEPSETAASRLRRNLQLNAADNVVVFNCAIADHDGFAWLHEPAGHLTNNSLDREFAAIFSPDIRTVPCVALRADRLSALVEDASRLLIKIDVEGYEPKLIRSLAPVIADKRPDIIIEVLPELADEIDAAVRAAAPGYRHYAITGRGLRHVEPLMSAEGRDCFLAPPVSTDDDVTRSR